MGLPGTAEEQLLRESQQLQTLSEIGRVLAATLEPRALHDAIFEQVARVMDASLFFMALHVPGRSELALPYVRERGTLLLDQSAPSGASVTSLVIEHGIPLRFGSLDEYLAYGRANGLEGISLGEHEPEAMIFVPLNTGNRTIGALSVQSLRPHAYTDENLEMLLVIAAQAAVATENARLYEESQNSVRHTQALLQAARTINSSLDLQTVLDSILAGMREVMPYYLAAVLMPDHAHSVLEVAGSIGPLTAERRREIKVPFGAGVTGTVFVTGEPLNVRDVSTFHDYFPSGLAEIKSEMAVPLKRGDTVIGVLDVERTDAEGFSKQDIDLLTLFASQASIAIENARLFAEEQSRVSELQAIQNLAQKLTPLHDAVAIAAAVDEELRRLIPYRYCRLYQVDKNQSLTPINFAGSDLGDLRLGIGEGIVGWIAEYGRSVTVPNALEDPRTHYLPEVPREPESVIGTALTYRGQVQGVIALSRPGVQKFDDNALRLLEVVGAQAAIALDRARIYEQLRLEAISDPLTKLFNRRYLIERYRGERSRAFRARHRLFAVMLDIDRFKAVNDLHGHDAGDLVLMEIAQLVRGLIRSEDLLARYGGEEFCLLLPEVTREDAAGVAERLRAAVERFALPDELGSRHVTVSVGVAELAPGDEDTELFSRADRAMYEAKRLGGNRVHLG